jgi:GT2 family glycosyltransferase
VSSSHNLSPIRQSGVKSVVVVILNWNSADDTLAAVESVLRMDYPNYRLVIVDNGSTDDSVGKLATIEDGRVKLIRSPENLGFTGGCNLGFDWALAHGTDYVWLLNSDAVTEIGTLSSLVAVAEADTAIGLVSPVIASLQQPSRMVYAGGFYDAQLPGCNMTRDVEIGSKWVKEHSGKVLLLGTALLVRVELIRRIGKLDDGFFAYWEDIDFSMRSNNAGFRNAVDFTSTVSHTEKFPTDRPQDIKPHFWYYVARNEIRFWKKHAGFRTRLRPLWWAYQLQLGHMNLVNGADASQQAILSGMWDGWLNRTGPYRVSGRMPRLIARVIEMHGRKARN